MRNIEKVIDEYLAKATDYAVQIVGNWGNGKTHFYRNNLEGLILNKETFEDASKTYKPIYVSLFGLKSTEDIATKIVMDFYQSKWFKQYYKSTEGKKRLKVTQSILKIGLRGFLNFQRLGNINDFMTDIKKVGESVLDAHELVICFDDLERKDSALKIEDLTGYINSLVDEGIKVLIISNEDLLLASGELYKSLKEKIIGVSIEFIPQPHEIIRNIIESRYSGFKDFRQYLDKNIDLILKTSYAAQNNFRHLIFSLDALFNIYSLLKSCIIDPKNEITEKLMQEIRGVTSLTLGLAVEYKSSTLKYTDRKEFKGDEIIFFQQILLDNHGQGEKKEDETVLEKYLKKYDIKPNEYRFYESIFNYVTAYEEFNVYEFIEEFKSKFNLNKGKTLPEYQLLEDLSYQQCFELSDEEYLQKTVALIEYAKKGKYAPAEYLTVMHCAERFENILSLNLEQIKNDLVGGLSTSIENSPLQAGVFTQFEMSGHSSEISQHNKDLHKIGMSIIRELREKRIKGKMEKIADLLISNPSEFEQQLQNNSDFRSEVSTQPLLKYIDKIKFFESIRNANANVIMWLRHFFKDRYEDSRNIAVEMDSLVALTAFLNEYSSDLRQHIDGNRIRSFVVSEFLKAVTEIIQNGKKAYSTVADDLDNDF